MLEVSQQLKLIRERRSVRTYDGRPLSEEHTDRLRRFMEDVPNPYGIPVGFRLLDAKRDGLSSPVLNRAETFVAAKVKRVPHAEEAYGYSFEALVLFARSLGIGTVWIGGTMNRAAFETAMELSADEMMPCASPLGYPAKKLSMRESLMRKAVKADSRLPFGSLFFNGTFDTPLTADAAGRLAQPLEMVRWSPSAVNKQPWRAVVDGDAVHFYLKRNKGFIAPATGNLQKIDLGIALCHFSLAAEEQGITIHFTDSDPKLSTGSDTEYIATLRLC